MQFYDSTRPQLIPAGATHAALYYDGDFAAPHNQAARFPFVRWITVLGDFEHAGIADYEPGNKVFDVPGLLRDYVQGRINMGVRARVYTDRSNLDRVHEQLGSLPYVVWLSTLDGSKPAGFWAVQFQGGPAAQFDVSELNGEW